MTLQPVNAPSSDVPRKTNFMARALLSAEVMRTIRLVAVLACVLCGTACDEKGPVGPTVPLNQQFTLSPGQAAAVAGTSLHVQFLRVSGDSRCPVDVFCVQGGDAIVHVRASDATSAEYELHTGNAALAVARHGAFRIELSQLQPYPFSNRTTESGDYRATLVISR